MGLAINLALANLFTGDPEEKALPTIEKKLTNWLRYVDDILAI